VFPVKRPSLPSVCERYGLPRGAQDKLRDLIELLADPTAPTAVTEREEAIDVHIADSLSVLPLVRPLLTAGRQGEAIVDIGSGAGFPGLPLAVALESFPVDLIESTQRKCRFIARAIERLALANAHAVCARAEDWARGEGAGRYRVAVVRAVAPLATLVEYASPLLTQGGYLVAWKGARDDGEERRGTAAASAVGMRLHSVEPLVPFHGSRRRHLYVFEKHTPTPPGIPRRAGMARKRPLGR
jgi:16S rRNA (guanine527-N7)-methyltransferase